jgi:hypothetical protein
VIDFQTLQQHRVLTSHHIVVVVLWEVRTQAVGWFGRAAVPDVIGQDQKVLADVERLTGSEQLVREERIQKRRRISARAMQ